MRLTEGLRSEYERLFLVMELRPEHADEVDRLVDQVAAGMPRYRAVAAETGVGWHVIAALHLLEAGLDWRAHLHNGDPLTRRTRRVPEGRPSAGSPPFTWEESAADALHLHSLHRWTDWSVGGTLYVLERFNGWGYRRRRPHVLSPYLWSFSRHYTTGKFVADGRFDPRATSQQCGAAVLLRALSDRVLCLLGTGRICGAISPDGFTCLREPHERGEHRDEVGLAWMVAP